MFSQLFSCSAQGAAHSNTPMNTAPALPSLPYVGTGTSTKPFRLCLSHVSVKDWSSSRPTWDVHSTVHPELEHTGGQVASFCSDHVKFDGTKDIKCFDWSSFKDAIDNLKDVDLAIEGYSSEPIPPAPVINLPTVFSEKMFGTFKGLISVEDITRTITQKFEHLDSAKSSWHG
ncbi:hypothetical protein FRC11_000442 [Ceratobasidium sp. 423]|nr:hypothetical protein FRC11_000442 [Ceratobasidium sp. 423]